MPSATCCAEIVIFLFLSAVVFFIVYLTLCVETADGEASWRHHIGRDAISVSE